MLDRARIKSRAKLRFIMGVGIDRGVHSISASVRAVVGANKNRRGEAVSGRIGSLINSFRASAIGCSSPIGPTMFGPFRS